MSRTYRFKKAQHILRSRNILYTWVPNLDFRFNEYRVLIDKSSDEYKKRIARIRSDKKRGAWIVKGPGWFHNLYSQRPYRRDAKNQIRQCLRDDDFEVEIIKKPKRRYWW